jgi:cytochrome c oxidase subunit III
MTTISPSADRPGGPGAEADLDLRPPEVEEHFGSFATQEHAVRFGMWLFLASEALLFGALFGLYTAYRLLYPEAFHAALHENSLVLGTVNTFVLVTSSFTVALAIHAMRVGRPRLTIKLLAVTIALGAVFLVLKGIEYAGHFSHGIFPGRYYAFEELDSFGANTFFTLYFFMTGLHALHVVGGLILLVVLAVLTHRHRVRPTRYTALDMGGLYWHLVDLIWLFLWPLFYLVG